MKDMLNYLAVALLVFATLIPTTAQAQIKRFEAADSEGVKASRDESTLYLKLDAEVKSPITIPRLAAPLRVATFANPEVDGKIKVVPKLTTWEIHWGDRPAGDEALLWLQFDAQPLLLSELKPTVAAGDGSFYLPAHFATTRGEKVRYEPQPKKNTVGYWVGKKDSAMWTMQLDEPGRFNVAVLQGCGKGQGGSTATMSFISPVKDITPTIDFEVVETGHWQNFQWVQHGEVELRHAGEVEVTVAPKHIKKAALMDIRAIHLIRLPDKKK